MFPARREKDRKFLRLGADEALIWESLENAYLDSVSAV